ncbi:MAG: glycosyltransferase family 2 protein [Ignavibacteriales bacterium]|nr:glycosyltransferase family 2 protein [Ignavibacteriales bacterium]
MTAVIIPAFNAEKSMSSLLSGIRKYVGSDAIVVVDDGSSDGTAAAGRDNGVVVISHAVNRGKGAALRTGIEHILASPRYDSVITMDADLQHDPEDIPKFLAAWQARDGDLILGSRGRFGSGMPAHRVLSNTITSALVSARTGVRIRDSQTGFRLISRQVLVAVKVDSDGYEAETEILIKAARKGFRISSVPIETIYAGAPSHMTHWKTTKNFLHVLLREYE